MQTREENGFARQLMSMPISASRMIGIARRVIRDQREAGDVDDAFPVGFEVMEALDPEALFDEHGELQGYRVGVWISPQKDNGRIVSGDAFVELRLRPDGSLASGSELS